jgi:hypothetical protein
MVAVVAARSFDDNDLRVIPAEEVEATERQREVRYV